jgi:ABC-type sugar transport system permease subunit
MTSTKTPTSSTVRSVPKRTLWTEICRSGWYYAFMAPWVILVALFVLYPQIASYPYTLLEGNLLLGQGRYVGFDNFQAVVRDEYFWRALRNTFIYASVLVPIQLFLALVLALTLNNPRLRFSNFYRALYFSPVVTGTAIIGIVMSMMFIYISPAVQPFLVAVGIVGPNENLNLLGDPRFALYAVIAMGIWKNLGINMIYFLAALQVIPKELYEAARIDGANPAQELRYITLPGLRETGIVIIFLAFLGSLQVFELVQAMIGLGATAIFADAEVVATYIYRRAFSGESNQGLASAAALTMGLITLLLTGLQMIVFRRFGIQRGIARTDQPKGEA